MSPVAMKYSLDQPIGTWGLWNYHDWPKSVCHRLNTEPKRGAEVYFLSDHLNYNILKGYNGLFSMMTPKINCLPQLSKWNVYTTIGLMVIRIVADIPKTLLIFPLNSSSSENSNCDQTPAKVHFHQPHLYFICFVLKKMLACKRTINTVNVGKFPC